MFGVTESKEEHFDKDKYIVTKMLESHASRLVN